MSTFAYKVRIDAKRQLERLKKNHPGAWLNDNKSFNPGLSLTHEKHKEKAKSIFESFHFTGYKIDQRYNDFQILLANLLRRKTRPLKVSLDRNGYTTNRYNKVSYYIIDIIHLMKKKGLIEMKMGFHTEGNGRQTRIWATDRLLRYFYKLPNEIVYKPVELVELKDAKGKLKEYKDTNKTIEIRSILQRANKINTTADIRYQDRKITAYLVAIFHRKFTLYGRLHTRGYTHQAMPKTDRAEITINGDPVIELDYSGLHPHLLYAQEGIQFNGDPYSIVDDRPEIRPFLKKILLALLNSKDEKTAERAANYYLRKNPGLRDIGVTRARPFLNAFKEAHQPISHYFTNGKDTGLRIMNKDSKIALDVIKHFSKQGIPILAVHDSFIVQIQHKSKLWSVMDETYRKHTKGFSCPIH